jgi:acyl-CoA dehydrogenase
MDHELSDDEVLIRDTARDFATEVLRGRAADVDRTERYPDEHQLRLADLGFFGFLVPEAYGGSKLGHAALALAVEGLASACASSALHVVVQNALVALPMARFGSEAQKTRFLAKVASGALTGAFAPLGAPSCGEPQASARESKGGGWELSGRLARVACGERAQVIILLATVESGPHAGGVSAFLIEGDAAGLSRRPSSGGLGLRGAEIADFGLDRVRVRVEDVLCGVGGGAAVAAAALDAARVGTAALAAGIIAASLEDSARYARERTQFGRRIGEFQPIQAKIAAMATDLDVARLLVRRAALRLDAGSSSEIEAARAHLVAARAATRAADQAVQIHGGAGYLKDFAVERYYRDAKTAEVVLGAHEEPGLAAARGILGL